MGGRESAAAMDPGAGESTYTVLEITVDVLEGTAAGKHFRVTPPATIGRGADCDVCLEDDPKQPTISRRHLEISLEGGSLAITDLSTNGTWVGAQRLAHRQKIPLPGGEMVHVGPRTTVAIRLEGAEELERQVEERDKGLRIHQPLSAHPRQARASLESMAVEPHFQVPSSDGLLLEIVTLGRFIVSVGGLPVPQGSFRTRKTFAVLVYLAEQAGSVSFDRLEETLWPDAAESARSALQTCVSRIRRSFREVASPVPLPDPIRSDRGSYSFDPAYRVVCDTTHFESLCDQGRRDRSAGRATDAASLLREAIALNHGPFLEGNTDHWADMRRQALRDQYCEALEILGDLKEKESLHDEAVRLYEKALARDPCRETSQIGLLRSLAACGLTAEAVRRYQAFVRLLQESMGLAPGPELLALYESLRGDPS